MRYSNPPRREQGVALVVALVLLLVVTMMGLASMRDTSLQERMSANMYDRSLAFQRAEAALRAAEAAITANWQVSVLNGVDCTTTACQAVPGNAFSGTDADWIDVVDDRYNVNESLAPGRPQYRIHFIGTGAAPSNYELSANADFGNYGSTYPPDNVAYYRVTARSSDPADSANRSIVVLQSTIKRAY